MDELIESKICNICKNSKPLTDFHPNKTCSKGVVGTCKICYKIRIRSWYDKTRETRNDRVSDRTRMRKKKAVEVFGGKCWDCEQAFPDCVFQFHHLDPSIKEGNPSAFISKSEERMWNELSKCVMLCANCHLIRHYSEERREDERQN